MEQQDLLQEVEQEIYFESASPGARFANYLIDIVGFYIVLFIGGIIYAFFVGVPDRISADENFSSRQSQGSGIAMLYLAIYSIYLLYYTVFEGATKGRTLGKLITGTRVVQEDGSPITWKNAFIRSLCRLVPFEPFSAFGTPWHDKWTGTQVIKVRK